MTGHGAFLARIFAHPVHLYVHIYVKGAEALPGETAGARSVWIEELEHAGNNKQRHRCQKHM